MEVATAVVGKLVDLLFLQIGRQFGYLLRYKDNINKLNQQVEDVKCTRGRMQVQIDEAIRKREIIHDDVLNWITSVNKITSESENFIAIEAEKKTTCFNISSRYNSSKEAKQKTSSIRELGVKEFVSVGHAAPPLGIDANRSRNVDAYGSQKSAMKQMMDALDDEKVYVVGVCGIGGAGKTTLVTELGKRVKESKKFDEVVMAVVSQAINKERAVQDVIAHNLGMDPLPDNNQLRREELWKRINKEKKILVILDDLWSSLNLEELGIPVGSHHSSHCQIILTSRSKGVCEEMEAQKIITVTPMPENEAWSLFKTVAGEFVETDSSINPIAIEVAKECGGLPVAILAVGRALRNKKRKLEWVDAHYQLKRAAPPSVNPMLKDVFPKLKLSYDYLEDEGAKYCFLLCCMFPEDYDIPVGLLAEYGMGLSLFRDSCGESLQEARRGARYAVNTLKNSCLLLDGKDNYHVQMHDVVRDVAIVISSKDETNPFLVKTGLGLKEWPEGDNFDKYAGISLVQNDISKLPVELELPKLQILLVQGNRSLSEIPHESFQGMKDLKVMDLHKCGISSLPRSLSLLTTLRSLHLDGSKFKEMSILEGLKKLEILGVSSTDINEIPEQIGSLSNLRFLDMRNCDKLSYIAAGVISSLQKLEDLYVGKSSVKWGVDFQEESDQQRKNASLKELESLPKLRFLDIVVPDIKGLPQDLQLKSLQRFVITIGSIFSYGFMLREDPDSSLLQLDGMNIPVLGWINKLMDAAEYLILGSITNLTNVTRDLNEVDFNNKRSLSIEDSDNVSCLVDTAALELKPAFCNLEQLEVKYLKNFSEICHGGQLLSAGGSFQKLREISVEKCDNMSAALGFNILISLKNLTTLKVLNCSSMEYILGSGPEIYNPGEGYTEILPMLKYLSLFRLPNLVDIWNGHNGKFVSHLERIDINSCNKLRRVFYHTHLKDLVRLRDIYISDCDSMEHIFEPELSLAPTEIIHGASPPPCLQNLVCVQIRGCGSLRYLFSPSVAEGLSQLRYLGVDDCDKMEAIIGSYQSERESVTDLKTEASSSSSSRIVLPNLSSIWLYSLDGLESFCSVPNYTSMEYPSLDSLEIDRCSKLKSWGFGIQVAPNLKPYNIKVIRCGGFALTKSDDERELIAISEG